MSSSHSSSSSSQPLQAIRGMNDILPPETQLWQIVENHLQQIFASYSYQEIRLPLLEKTELFKRGIGEATDIVEKEMYTFLDRHGENLTLRPEGTASCVRAAIEHKLLHHQTHKFWYQGPMYRYERPQKGRYRQFYQVGAETFGFAGFQIEAELILLSARLWQVLGIAGQVELHVNSLGDAKVREAYRADFVAYCRQYQNQLDEDSQRRLETNPLRILDSKNAGVQELLLKAPVITDYLDVPAREQFENLCAVLTQMGICYTINPRLVRGLDYYTGAVFEWITASLGAQGAVCAGGRYDNLVEFLGGESTPAVGFALGMERVVALLENSALAAQAGQLSRPDIFMILACPLAEKQGLQIAERLRDSLQNVRIWIDYLPGNFKAHFKRADKSGARFALILGEDECQKNVITCKNLRDGNVPQQELEMNALISYLRSVL